MALSQTHEYSCDRGQTSWFELCRAIIDALIALFAIATSTQRLDIANPIIPTFLKGNNVVSSKFDFGFPSSAGKTSIIVECHQRIPLFKSMRSFCLAFTSATAISGCGRFVTIGFSVGSLVSVSFFLMSFSRVTPDFAIVFKIGLAAFTSTGVDFITMSVTIFA